MSPFSPPRARTPFSRSPAALLHSFCGATSLGWMLLLALTFTDRSLLILLATLAWCLVATWTLLLSAWLSFRHISWKTTAMIGISWCLLTVLISNMEAALGQRNSRLWSGFVFDARYGWYPEANLRNRVLRIPQGTYAVSTDEFGHRNSLPYPEDRILPCVLQGDSHAFGFGLSETQTLSALLNSHCPDQSTYNVGVPGFDLNHYYFQYQELANQFTIEQRVILWNSGNDFTLSALETPNFFRRPFLFVEQNSIHLASDFRSPFPVQGYGQSFVPPYREFDAKIQTWADDWADLYPAPLIQFPLTRQVIKTYHPKFCRLGQFVFPSQPQIELFDPAWMLLRPEFWPEPYRQYSADLPLLLRQLKSQNRRLTICMFPFREQIIPAEFQQKTDSLLKQGYKIDQIEALSFNRYFKSICDAEMIRLVDPTPAFLDEPNPTTLYQTGDQHLSAKGMQLCAAALLSQISRHAESLRHPEK